MNKCRFSPCSKLGGVVLERGFGVSGAGLARLKQRSGEH